MEGVAGTYEEPRAHALRERYLASFGGPEIPVDVESIAGDLLGLEIEESWDIDYSGMLLPLERRILLSARERGRNDPPLRRYRFTIAHEIGHWICHCGGPVPQPRFCRARDLREDTDRTLEREANVFAAELLMPEEPLRRCWHEVPASVNPIEWTAARFDVSPSAMHWRLYS